MIFTTQEFQERIERLQAYLTQNDIDVAMLNQNADLYYYAGSVQPLYLLVPAQAEPVLLARKAVEQVRKEAPHIALEPFYSTKDLAEVLKKRALGSPKRVGYTFDATVYGTVSRFQQTFGEPEAVDISWDIRTIRMVKSEAEIALIARAGEVSAQFPDLVREHFRPGMTEIEMSVVLESHLRLSGHTGIIRCRREAIDIGGLGVVASGPNTLAGTKFDGICTATGLSVAAPHGASYDRIRQGVPVLMDYSVNIEGYHDDQTRMFSWGSPSEQVLEAYDAMLKVEDSIIIGLVPGRKWEDLYNDAVALASGLGYEEEFMGLGSEKVRFVGHGLGVELDEPPYLAPKMTEPLEERMVVAVEPKVALPGIGVVGPEDTLVIRKDGPQRLTTCSREFIIV